MLNYFNDVGVFRNDNAWFPCYYTMNMAWNYSDASRELCKVNTHFNAHQNDTFANIGLFQVKSNLICIILLKELTEAGLLSIVVKNLGHEPYKANSSSKVRDLLAWNAV